MDYPVFEHPDSYLKTRRGSWVYRFFKERGEQRALDQCLSSLTDVRLVCDAPCGFGHLFPYWHRKKFRFIGLDLSMPMVTLARERLREQKINGEVRYGDIFSLSEHLKERPDLIACVRFIYYFERSQRVKLLQALAAASNRYVLVQYRTKETFRGRWTLYRRKRQGVPIVKQFSLLSEIEEELREAGLAMIRAVPISQFSDRIFVIANKQV